MTIKAIYPPPAGRPRWSSKATIDAGLDYLSWGWREYGRHPIPLARHDGWTYQVVVEGTVHLRLEHAEVPIRDGTMVLVSPECAYGWSGQASNRCKILSWIWRDAPADTPSHENPTAWQTIALSPSAMRTLNQLHRETRSEATLEKPMSSLALRTIRARIDILLARTIRLGSEGAKSRFRIAWQWLLDHPGELRPVSALCDHLQVSASTLQRLFHQYKKMSVREAALTIRMHTARELLKMPSHSVKEIAMQLGYAHANDFSRAYSSFWHQPPASERSSRR